MGSGTRRLQRPLRAAAGAKAKCNRGFRNPPVTSRPSDTTTCLDADAAIKALVATGSVHRARQAGLNLNDEAFDALLCQPAGKAAAILETVVDNHDVISNPSTYILLYTGGLERALEAGFVLTFRVVNALLVLPMDQATGILDYAVASHRREPLRDPARFISDMVNRPCMDIVR